jgi:flavodoxin
VYDSWFDNTRAIANVIADGLGGDVEVVKVGRNISQNPSDYELVIVGSPTHGGVATPAMQEFLQSLGDDDLEGIAVAAFDTRASYRWLKVVGFAAKRIAKQLQEKGGTLIIPPEGFYVDGKEGPLKSGEVLRAQRWARMLASQTENAKV